VPPGDGGDHAVHQSPGREAGLLAVLPEPVTRPAVGFAVHKPVDVLCRTGPYPLCPLGNAVDPDPKFSLSWVLSCTNAIHTLCIKKSSILSTRHAAMVRK
jgi:hypothetical protein